MRIPEKTIEINFCAQLSSELSAKQGVKTLWFGLTQTQEKIAGVDACTKIGGRLFLFQFKASNQVLVDGARRFYAQHHQMVSLQQRCRNGRSVFYVFPDFGTTQELRSINYDFIGNCKLLDVMDIPPGIAEPTTRQGNKRKKGHHHVNVAGNKATIHSKPVEVALVDFRDLANDLLESEGVDRQLIEELTMRDEGEWPQDNSPAGQTRPQQLFYQQAFGLVVFTQSQFGSTHHDH
jgi:hypothetical protein